MISKTPLKKIISTYKKRNKLDNRGALLIPINFKIKDTEFMHYRHLPINWEIEPVKKEDLPAEFSSGAVKIVDLFRRKTIDLSYEIMLIFDYKTGELIYCFVNQDEEGEVFGNVDEDVFVGKDIAIIHNHPKGFYSPPSSRNFQILSLEFQHYEVVSSWDALWILESKFEIHPDKIQEIKEEIHVLYEISTENSYSHYSDKELGFKKASEDYGELLLKYINNVGLNIKLIRRGFNDN